MDVKEKIVKLLTEFYDVDPMYLGADTNTLIEYLIAKGVTVQETARRCADGKPVTNADRIRAMSDEELAMCLYEIGYDEGWDEPEYALKWLQQPSEED